MDDKSILVGAWHQVDKITTLYMYKFHLDLWCYMAS